MQVTSQLSFTETTNLSVNKLEAYGLAFATISVSGTTTSIFLHNASEARKLVEAATKALELLEDAE